MKFVIQNEDMKKIVAIWFFIFSSLFSIFAEGLVVHSLNISVPFGHNTWDVDYPADAFFNADSKVGVNSEEINFNWNRMTVGDEGFSFLFGMGVGFAAAEPKKFVIDSMVGWNYAVKLGWGFAPVRTEKMILAFHGIATFNLKFLFYKEEVSYSADGSNKIVESETYDYNVVDFGNAIGADVVFIYRPRPVFALMAGLDVTTNFIGFGFCEIDYTDSPSDLLPIFYGFTGINITPRIGICWVFD